MEIQQHFSVPFPVEAVWRSFHDTAGLVACLPGAALAEGWEDAPDGKLPLSMTVKLGPIVAAFAGEGALTLDETARTGAVTGSGADRKSGSRVKGEAAFSLHPEAGEGGTSATRVEIAVDFSIAGSLAQFSRGGIVRELAARLTDAFAANLKAKLEAEALAGSPGLLPQGEMAETPTEEASDGSRHMTAPDPVAPAPDEPRQPTAAPPTPQPSPRSVPQAAPLDVGALFWPALWSRLRQLLGMQPRR